MLHCFAVFTGNCEGDWKDVNKNLQKALNNNQQPTSLRSLHCTQIHS